MIFVHVSLILRISVSREMYMNAVNVAGADIARVWPQNGKRLRPL